MASVKFLLAEKSRRLVSIGSNANVLDAARLMNKHHIGALVVIEKDKLLGVFTERDVLCRVVVDFVNPEEVPVCHVMTTQVITCSEEMTVREAASLMKFKRIRHLPVLDKDKHVIGMISIGDINAHHRVEAERTAKCLLEYIHA